MAIIEGAVEIKCSPKKAFSYVADAKKLSEVAFFDA